MWLFPCPPPYIFIYNISRAKRINTKHMMVLLTDNYFVKSKLSYQKYVSRNINQHDTNRIKNIGNQYVGKMTYHGNYFFVLFTFRYSFCTYLIIKLVKCV